MKRTPDDICLLCQSRKSVKTKSHIIPKFFANSFLMDNDILTDSIYVNL